MLISLIHPSRQRPHRSFDTILKWILESRIEHDKIEVVVSIDSDDPTISEYIRIYKDMPQARVIINNNRSAVDAVNHAASASNGDILIVVSDDFDPCQRWAREIIKTAEGKSEFVVKVNDGVQKWIITLPILSRAYYNRLGYVYHPNFKHMFVDTFFTHQAEVNEVIVQRNDLLFKHNHYSILRVAKDDVSLRADRTWEQGKREYLNIVSSMYGNIFNWGLRSKESYQHVLWLKKANKRYD